MKPKYFNLDDSLAEGLERAARLEKQSQVLVTERSLYKELKNLAVRHKDDELRRIIHEFEKRQIQP